MIPTEERMGMEVTESCCHLLRNSEIKDDDYEDILTRCKAVQSGRCVLTLHCIYYPDNEVLTSNFHGGTVYVRKTEPT
jgi:hypothetical protein